VITITENPQAIASMPAYCFDYDINNKDNWHTFNLEGENRLATLMDNFHLAHSVFYSLVRTKGVARWFEEHEFLPINGYDWLFILYLACSGDVVRTTRGFMVGGTQGISRQSWLYKDTLFEIHVPLYRVYAKIDEMIQAAEGISITQKYLACARLFARKHEVGEQISNYWNTLDSPLIPLYGFSRLEPFEGGMLVQWCTIGESEAKVERNLSIALNDTQRAIDIFFYNPDNQPRVISLINPGTKQRLDMSLHSGKNQLDMAAIRKQLLVGSYAAIILKHNFPASEIQPSFGGDKIFFGVVRDFKNDIIINYNPKTTEDKWLKRALARAEFKAKCFVRKLIPRSGTLF
jgi:hypothetical protein